MNKDFVEVTNDSGTNNGSFDIVCGQNSGNERSTILTVSGGEVNKTINITQNCVPKINMIEIGGYVFEIDRARSYWNEDTFSLISVNCILSVEHINQGSNIENVSIYNIDGFGIDWDLVTDCEIQCLAAYEEDFRTTIQNNGGTNMYYRSDSGGVIEAVMNYSEVSYCNANIAAAVGNANGSVEIIFNTPGKGFKVTIQIVS